MEEHAAIRNPEGNPDLAHEKHTPVHTPMTKDAGIVLAVSRLTVQEENVAPAGPETK